MTSLGQPYQQDWMSTKKERSIYMSERRPVPFVVYKGSGALRLQLLPAEPREEGSPFLKEGCVMLEMALAKGEPDVRGNRSYDWENRKIIFKLSSKDIGDILAYMKTGAKGELKLVHDSSKAPGAGDDAGMKNLTINSTDRSWFWNLSMSKEQRVSVPVDTSEMVRIQELLKEGIKKIYAWS
jgi:hypothetical protein